MRTKTFAEACFKWYINNYEISLAADDACSEDGIFKRNEIRIYDGKNYSNNITAIVFPDYDGYMEASIENMQWAFHWCQNH